MFRWYQCRVGERLRTARVQGSCAHAHGSSARPSGSLPHAASHVDGVSCALSLPTVGEALPVPEAAGHPWLRSWDTCEEGRGPGQKPRTLQEPVERQVSRPEQPFQEGAWFSSEDRVTGNYSARPGTFASLP